MANQTFSGQAQTFPYRPARLATMVANSPGSTGLGTCAWNPALSASRASSARANAVSASAEWNDKIYAGGYG